MKIPVLLGILAGGFCYLYYLGFDIIPLLVLLGLGGVIYFFMKKNGIFKLDTYRKVVQESKFKFEDIGGNQTPKQELKEALEFLIKSELVNQMGIRPIKGILLAGPPGTGKTLLAKAAAGYSDSVFLATSGSEFIEMYAGVGAQRVRTLFQTAREMAKKEKKNRAVIFIDEIDVLGGKRGANSSHLEYDQTLNQLLVEMDGLTNNQEIKILLIAATNRPDLLDTALLRPGRFDRQVKVDLPDRDGRLAILKLHCNNKPLDQGVNLEEIAGSTFGFSGAHLESLANEAAILALRDKGEKIKQEHLREAVDKVILGEKLGNRASREILNRVAVHEAGHALISELLNSGSVEQVTVTSRGNALGYVRHSNQEDEKLYTKSKLESQIMVLLAGALSEQLVLGEKSTGSANDFQRSLELTEKFISAGLSRLGVVSTELLPRNEFYLVSQEILGELENRTIELLSQHIQTLLKIVDILEVEEKISGNKLRDLLAIMEKTAMPA